MLNSDCYGWGKPREVAIKDQQDTQSSYRQPPLHHELASFPSPFLKGGSSESRARGTGDQSLPCSGLPVCYLISERRDVGKAKDLADVLRWVSVGGRASGIIHGAVSVMGTGCIEILTFSLTSAPAAPTVRKPLAEGWSMGGGM